MEASETHIKSFPDPLFTYFVRHESSKSQREKVDESTRAVNDRQEPSKSSCKQKVEIWACLGYRSPRRSLRTRVELRQVLFLFPVWSLL